MCDEKKGEFFYLVELRFFLLKDSKKLAIGGEQQECKNICMQEKLKLIHNQTHKDLI